MVKFLADCSFVKIWNILLLSISNSDENEKLAERG